MIRHVERLKSKHYRENCFNGTSSYKSKVLNGILFDAIPDVLLHAQHDTRFHKRPANVS